MPRAKKKDSNLNKWNEWYKDVEEREAYGDSFAYREGAAFLEDCETVEDWGCGKGWFKNFRADCVGIDGSESKFCDKHEDLEKYTSDVEGIFMRGVLEHNYGWQNVLDNALKSFNKKMVLVLFTPLVDETKEIAFIDAVGVPNISFKLEDITDHFGDDITFTYETKPSEETYYGEETIFFLEKKLD